MIPDNLYIPVFFPSLSVVDEYEEDGVPSGVDSGLLIPNPFEEFTASSFSAGSVWVVSSLVLVRRGDSVSCPFREENGRRMTNRTPND